MRPPSSPASALVQDTGLRAACRGGDRSRQGEWFGGVLGVSAFAQVALLAFVERLSGAAALAALGGGVVAGAVIARGWVLARRGGRAALTMTLVTLALGGVGMLCGSLLDGWALANAQAVSGQTVTAAVPPCHAALVAAGEAGRAAPEAGGLGSLASWMNLLMLLGCVPACALTCRRVRAWVHGVGGAGMFGGMIAGGAWLGPALATRLSPGVAAHLSMLAGMTAGTALFTTVSVRISQVRHGAETSRDHEKGRRT